MDVTAVAINAAVIGAVGLILGWLGKGRFEAADRRFDRLEDRLEHRMDTLERRMDTFQASMDVMRSDLTQVALAVGVRPRATNA
ncbi:MAG TPA: hypothetical protein VFK59_09285 [Actinomycetota bacterium]|nr:hypothetical protein [Actinomycetota bacterium]